MTEVVKHITIELREGTAAEWSSSGRILRAGEMGLETDTFKMKFGNGITGWAALPYFINQTQIATLIQAAIDGAVIEGVPGDSAYQVAVDNGFVGTEEEWLESLVGPQGIQGNPGTNGTNGSNGAQGIQGIPGTNGTNGTDGDDGVDGVDGNDGESVTVTLVAFASWPPASDSNPNHLYFRLPE